MGKPKLKAALKEFKEFDPKKAEQKKLRKKAEQKKKRQAEEEPEEKEAIDIAHIDDTDSSGDDSDDAEEDELVLGDSKSNGVSLFAASNAILNGAAHDDEDDEDDEEDEEDDIPFSDIASLDSEDRGDIVPYQRLTINNHAALTTALNRIALPLSTLPFSAHHTITATEPTMIKDIDDDLSRELAFYAQSLAAVKSARKQLKDEGIPFTRPTDYFAEMVKSEEHMGRVRQRLVDDAAGKKAAAEARRQRDLKKFGKAVQVAKLQERDKAKRDTIEKINTLKRSTLTFDLP
jgi:rRNA-processing protein EBP2